MEDVSASYLENTFPGAILSGQLMKVPGLAEGYGPENLVAKAYGKMCRFEVNVPMMIMDDLHLQKMLRTYADNLREMGHSEEPGSQAWMKQCDPGSWMDEVLMNVGIAAMYFPDDVAVMRSDSVAVVQSYVERFRQGKLSTFKAAEHCVEVVRNQFGGSEYTIGFIPMCNEDHWGFVMVQSTNGHTLSEEATVSWGDSMNLKPDAVLLSGIIALLRAVFPQGSFRSIAENYFGTVVSWEPQQDWWSCGIYVLAVIRTFAIGSDFIPGVPLEKYDSVKIENIRKGCENAMWYTVLTHLYVFGEGILPETIQAHIYCGLHIRKDQLRFYYDCVTVRQIVWEMDESNQGRPAPSPRLGITDVALRYVDTMPDVGCTGNQDADQDEDQDAGNTGWPEVSETFVQGTEGMVPACSNIDNYPLLQRGNREHFKNEGNTGGEYDPIGYLDKEGQATGISSKKDKGEDWCIKLPDMRTDVNKMEEEEVHSGEEEDEDDDDRWYDFMDDDNDSEAEL